MNILIWSKNNWSKILSIFLFITLFGVYAYTFATPPATKYNAGETLDPTCIPGDTNCTVDTKPSQWITTGSDIYYNDGNVGIGTDNPTSKLDIRVGEITSNIDQGFSENDGNGDSLDDATFSGTYNQSYDNYIYVHIDNEGTPDTFSYWDDNGDCSDSNIPITGSSQYICDGISITFASTTGHSLNDEWYYGVYHTSSITSTNPVLNISDGINNYFTVNAVAPYSIFLGESSGYYASSASYSNFLGNGAGYSATNANNSNFLGSGAGYYASSASDSNFLGSSAGYSATLASNSNFLGSSAGQSATSAYNSNFLGNSAGQSATSAYNSNFLGNSAGYSATNANNSNFLGSSAGQSATNANNSNFLGAGAGYFATSAYYSNFLGNSAGRSATSAYYSNFLGNSAGRSATSAYNSNFLGNSAGYSATNAYNSNFLGLQAGYYATNAANSIFIGYKAGYQDTVNNTSNGLSSILIGSFTNTGGYSNSILLGSGTSGSSISNTKANQFMLAPTITEMRLRGVDYTLPSSQGGAGTVLTNNGSGVLSWTTVSGGGGSSPWLLNGSDTYYNDGNVGIGTNSPTAKLDIVGTINAYKPLTHDVFKVTTDLGYRSYSIFVSGESNPRFYNVGSSIWFGGGSSLVDVGLFRSTSNVLKIDGRPTNGNGNLLVTGNVGIGTDSLSYSLHVGNSSISGIVARFENSSGTCDINPTTSSLACSSDINLKKNITNLKDNTDYIYNDSIIIDNSNESILYKLNLLTPVKYNWNKEDNNNTKHIGFIAQEVEQVFPDLVSTDPDTDLKSISYTNFIPYTISAIQELDLKVKEFSSLDIVENNSLASLIKNYLSDIGNQLEVVFFGEVHTKKLCIDNVCIDKTQLEEIINKNNVGSSGSSNSTTSEDTQADNTQTDDDTSDSQNGDSTSVQDDDESTTTDATANDEPSASQSQTGSDDGSIINPSEAI